jgi:hypothetical protein
LGGEIFIIYLSKFYESMYPEKLILIILSVLILKSSFSQNNPDSVIYILDEWGLTTITTISTQQQDKHVYPFCPPTPLPVNVTEMCTIFMTIYDESYMIKDQYEFKAFAPGRYNIKWWAFYEKLLTGFYKVVLEWQDNCKIY